MKGNNIHRLFAICGLLVACFATAHTAAQPKTVNLVTFERGELPIILSSPHGGRRAIAGVPERKGKGVRRFNTARDVGTDQLAEQLAGALQRYLGKRPYVVIARFHRKYLDANRAERDAYESQKAKVYYDTYHRALATACREAVRRWGCGMLFDLHGQKAEPKAIFRGTQNGATVRRLIERFGREALFAKAGLFGIMAEQGLTIIPAPGEAGPEDARYDGGYIVRRYSRVTSGNISAIQLELGRALRSAGRRTATADKLAAAIAAFARKYLPKEPARNTPRGNPEEPLKAREEPRRVFFPHKASSRSIVFGSKVSRCHISVVFAAVLCAKSCNAQYARTETAVPRRGTFWLFHKTSGTFSERFFSVQSE